MVVVVLLKAGVQVPVIPLVEVVGSGARFSPEQIGFTGSKIGFTIPFPTLTFKVYEVAHEPGAGVKT